MTFYTFPSLFLEEKLDYGASDQQSVAMPTPASYEGFAFAFTRSNRRIELDKSGGIGSTEKPWFEMQSSDMREVLVLQHAIPETPGIIAEVVSQHGIGIHTVRSFAGEAVPADLGDSVGLIVMGGPMGVYERDRYGFLRNELHLIEQVLHENKPVLGICLGSQLLAAVLGADVRKGAQKEIGWYPVQLSKEALLDTIWKEAPRSFTAFHWHGDVFNVPDGSVSLASSERTPCQAFRYGTNAYGLLFHLEVTERIMNDMVRAFDEEFAGARIDARKITREARNNLATSQKIGAMLFDRWCVLLHAA